MEAFKGRVETHCSTKHLDEAANCLSRASEDPQFNEEDHGRLAELTDQIEDLRDEVEQFKSERVG